MAVQANVRPAREFAISEGLSGKLSSGRMSRAGSSPGSGTGGLGWLRAATLGEGLAGQRELRRGEGDLVRNSPDSRNRLGVAVPGSVQEVFGLVPQLVKVRPGR